MANLNAKTHYRGYTGLTASQIADFLGKTLTTAEQNILLSLISSIESFIALKCRRNFKYDDVYEETFDAGNNKYEFYNFPVDSIEKITIDTSTIYEKGSQNNMIELNKDFFVYDDFIVFETYLPQSSTNNRRALKIQYKIKKFWGDEVVNAVKMWTAQIFNSKEYGGKTVNSFSFSGLSLSFKDEEIPSFVKEVINTYKKVLL